MLFAKLAQERLAEMIQLRKHTDEVMRRMRAGDDPDTAFNAAEALYPIQATKCPLCIPEATSISPDEEVSQMSGLDEEDLYEFHLIEGRYGTWWHEYALHPFDGHMAYLNFAGAGHAVTGKEKVVRKVMAESFSDLDWVGTALEQPDSDAGWLDRDGRLHGCHSQAHDMYARYRLKLKVADLEDAGWVRVYGKISEPQWMLGFRDGLRLSAGQRAWLNRNEYEVRDWD